MLSFVVAVDGTHLHTILSTTNSQDKLYFVAIVTMLVHIYPLSWSAIVKTINKRADFVENNLQPPFDRVMVENDCALNKTIS